MGLRIHSEDLPIVGQQLARAGFRRIEWAEDGSVAAAEMHDRRSDTEPCPPPAIDDSTILPPPVSGDPLDDEFRDDEVPSDRIARELRLLGTDGREAGRVIVRSGGPVERVEAYIPTTTEHMATTWARHWGTRR